MRAQLLHVPVERIDPPTSNPRFEPADLDELAASIREVGILEPLIGVAAGPERVRLVAGLRRFTSARQVGLASVPMLVYPRLTAREELAVSLVENLHRKDMTPIERGEAFVKLIGTGMSQLQVSKMIGVSDYTVSIACQIVRRCIPEVKDACHAGEITQMDAVDLSKQTPAAQRALLDVMLSRRAAARDYEANRRHEGRQSGRGRSEAEAHLRAAMTALKAQDRTLAIEMTEKALVALRRSAMHVVA